MFRDGKLVLIKSFFESILIFWIPLSWIPKDILKRMHKYCFTYLWRGSVDHQVMAWIHWERLAIQKALRGRGLKNIFLFAKALAAKVSWSLIHSKSLWTRMVQKKYIAPLTILVGSGWMINCGVVALLFGRE